MSFEFFSSILFKLLHQELMGFNIKVCIHLFSIPPTQVRSLSLNAMGKKAPCHHRAVAIWTNI